QLRPAGSRCRAFRLRLPVVPCTKMADARRKITRRICARRHAPCVTAVARPLIDGQNPPHRGVLTLNEMIMGEQRAADPINGLTTDASLRPARNSVVSRPDQRRGPGELGLG